jgi:hypothetical protein
MVAEGYEVVHSADNADYPRALHFHHFHRRFGDAWEREAVSEWVGGEPRCTHCGGLHYGSPRNRCVYLCKQCGKDIRPDSVPRCECVAAPGREKEGNSK